MDQAEVHERIYSSYLDIDDSLRKIDKKIDTYLQELDKGDAAEADAQRPTSAELQEKIERMRAAGIAVAERIEEIPELIRERLVEAN